MSLELDMNPATSKTAQTAVASKKCERCKKAKTLTSFAIDLRAADKHRKICTSCTTEEKAQAAGKRKAKAKLMVEIGNAKKAEAKREQRVPRLLKQWELIAKQMDDFDALRDLVNETQIETRELLRDLLKELIGAERDELTALLLA